MPKKLQFRRGSKTDLQNQGGVSDGEIFIDKESNEVVVGNDSTVGSKFRVENIEKSRVMTEAEYRTLQEMRRRQFAGSGFVEWGGQICNWKPGEQCVNKGLWTGVNNNTRRNTIFIDEQQYSKVKPTKVNINGNLLRIYGVNKSWSESYINVIKLPEPPTSKATVTDSSNLPIDLKQGDFIILKDFDRELVTNGTFDEGIDGWIAGDSSRGSINYDSENKRIEIVNDGDGDNPVFYQEIKFIKGVKYKIRFTLDINDAEIVKIATTGFELSKTFHESGDYEIEYIPSGPKTIYFYLLEDGNTGHKAYFDNISIKQVEETPLVALQNVESGIDIYENVSKFEVRDSISRQDFIFPEYWEEDIEEKDVVYPYGNIQYRGGNIDGVSGITEPTWFSGYDTYSLFGNWQNPGDLIGKGYRWSQLSEEEKLKLASNRENNIFLSKDGRWMQGRYRIRVVKGLGNEWENVDPTVNKMLAYNSTYGKYGRVTVKASQSEPYYGYDLFGADYNTYRDVSTNGPKHYVGTFIERYGNNDTANAIPIALVQRRNDGVFHKVYNPEGTAVAKDSDGNALSFEQYALDNSVISSLSDCFDPSKRVDGSGYIASGQSGHEAGLYADEINEMDVEDLRMDARKKPLAEILEEERSKDIRGERRGKENRNLTYKANFRSLVRSIKNSPNFSDIWKTPEENDHIWLLGISLEYDLNFYNTDNVLLGFLRKKSTNEFFFLGKDKSSSYTFFKPLGHARLYKTIEDLNNNNFTYVIFTNYNDFELYLIDKYFLEKKATYTFSNTYIQTDIIGDPRPLKDRIEYTVTDADKEINIHKNMYIKCNDATNNSGTVGHIYRYLGNDISGVHTNSTDGSANANDGHIDFSDTNKWLDLGTDGNIGGYPQEWLSRGFAGTPLIVGEEGESLLPVDLEINENGRLPVKLSKRALNMSYMVLFSKKDGSFVKGYYDAGNINVGYTGGDWTPENVRRLNISKAYSDLGYSSEEEMLDLMKVVVIYKTKANFMELADNSEVLSMMNFARYTKWNDDYLIPSLINKVGASKANNNIANLGLVTSLEINGKRKIYANNTYKLPNVIENWSLETSKTPTVKTFGYITQENNRLYLQYVFKELKYDSETNTWGDDNKFQIVDKLSTKTDLNSKTVLVGQKRVALPYFYTGE